MTGGHAMDANQTASDVDARQDDAAAHLLKAKQIIAQHSLSANQLHFLVDSTKDSFLTFHSMSFSNILYYQFLVEFFS